MRTYGFRRFVIRAVVVLAALLICGMGLIFAEQWRTQAEMDNVLSAYLSDAILQDVHDWGSGHNVLVVLQQEAQVAGTWRFWWLYPFDSRLRFAGSSFVTRCSFRLNNAIPTDTHFGLRLPAGVRTAVASRSDLERTSFTGVFQARFPNNMGYIAVSHAGFNLNRTEAIFYIDHFCGLCGGGRFVLTRKVADVWKVIDEHYTWIS